MKTIHTCVPADCGGRRLRWAPAALLLCLAGLHGCTVLDEWRGGGVREWSSARPAGIAEEQEQPQGAAAEKRTPATAPTGAPDAGAATEGGTGVAPVAPAPALPPPVADDRIDLA